MSDHARTGGDPQVTILMPVYNGQATLEAALASAVAQLGSQACLLIVDDQSSDASWELLSNLTDPRITVRRNARNLGLYATLDHCVREVRTPWTALLFQDDLLAADYLNEMLGLARAYPMADALWSAHHTVDAGGRPRGEGLDTGRVEVIPPGFAPWTSALLRGTYWTISGSFTRTSLLRQLGFRADLPHLGDYDFLLRSTLSATFLYYERPLLCIRQHAGQASSNNLAALRDLRERVAVIEEQLSRHADQASLRLRMRVLRGLAKNIALRAGSRARRGDARGALLGLGLVPRAMRACAATGALGGYR